MTQLPAPVDLAASWDPALANPYLDGQVAAAEVNGIQSQGEMAEVKHFAVYNQETNRNTPADDAIVSERAIQEIYSPAWSQVIDQSSPAAIMCAYSTVNGQYACQNPGLLTGELDGQLGYQGYVGSDYGATHSTVAAVNSGLDQEQPESTYFGAALQQAVQDGQVSQSTINQAVVRILTEMYRFRLFTDYPTGNINATVTDPAGGSPVLPYASSTPSIAVIGADASTSPMTDGGSASVVPSSVVTPLQGIRAAASARQAVVFVNDVESEGVDRGSLELPGNSDQLIEAVAAANRVPWSCSTPVRRC